LEANDISRKMMNNLANLNLEQMKEFSLVILSTSKHISVTIKYLEELLTALM